MRSLPAPSKSIVARSVAAVVALCLSLGLLVVSATPIAAQNANAGQQRIEGPRWQLLEYRNADGDLQLVPPGIGATALLWYEVISGEGACSTYRTDYTLQRDTLIIDQPQVTPRGCDAEAKAIDEAFFRNLTETASWSSDGSVMELRDPVGDVLMTFTDAQLPNDPTIAPWQLARIAAPDGSIGPVVSGSDPAIYFLRGGHVVGTTGCGWFVGSYTTNDTLMTISNVDQRAGECGSALIDQADNVINTFAEITEFRVLPAGLSLQDASGQTRMALVPVIPLADRTWTPVEVLDESGTSLVDAVRLRTSAVRFGDARADGRTICRSYVADSLRSGLALTVFNVKGDKAPCRRRLQKNQTVSQAGVEQLFLQRLENTSSLALRGSELELMNASGTPIMRLHPQPEFVGVPWKVVRMDVAPNASKERLRAPKGTEPLTATFETIDVVQGFTGKNGYIAYYNTPRAATISITDLEVDGRKCSGKRARNPLCRQEAAFIKLLESADSFYVAPEGMTLLRGSRKIMELEEDTQSGSQPG